MELCYIVTQDLQHLLSQYATQGNNTESVSDLATQTFQFLLRQLSSDLRMQESKGISRTLCYNYCMTYF